MKANLLFERRRRAWEQAHDLADLITAEDRSFTAAEQARWDALAANLDRIDRLIGTILPALSPREIDLFRRTLRSQIGRIELPGERP